MIKPNIFIVFLCICSLLCSLIIPVIAQEKQNTEILYCPQCGKENAMENKFCFNCGTKLPERKPEKEIPKVPPIHPWEKVPSAASSIGKTISDSLIDIKAKALYDHGSALYEVRDYVGALEEFNKIVRTYPTSKYYESALVMMKACQQLITVQQGVTTGQVKKRTQSSFEAGVQTGCLAVLGLVGLLALIGALSN